MAFLPPFCASCAILLFAPLAILQPDAGSHHSASFRSHVKIGVRAFGEGLSIIPRTLCSTMGRDDAAYVLIELQEAHKAARKKGTGVWWTPLACRSVSEVVQEHAKV